MVQAAVADVIGPAIASDDPYRALDQHIGQALELLGLRCVQSVDLVLELGHPGPLRRNVRLGRLLGLPGPLSLVPLLLLFGEVTPKTISVSDPVRISTGVVAAPMSLWVRVVSPLVWLIRSVADRITTLIVGEEKAAENILQLDEFRTLVEEVAKEGELNATERALIYNLLEAGDTEVVEIMTPRTRTAFLNADMSVPEMVERFRTFRHPRVPVFRIHRDNLVGFVHAEDVLRHIIDNTDLSTLVPDDIMHPPVVVPLTKKVDEMFDFFQERNARAAAVLNEFGGVEGFVTMKDVLKFIFGGPSHLPAQRLKPFVYILVEKMQPHVWPRLGSSRQFEVMKISRLIQHLVAMF